MQRTRFGDMACSIARTVDVLGEPWTPLILRDVWRGLVRFDELQAGLGISRKVLAERLKTLLEHGVLERHAYTDRPPRYTYTLTIKGSELFEVLLAMTAWGDRWAAGDAGPPALLRHRTCGHDTHAERRCAYCGNVLHASDLEAHPGPGLQGDTTTAAEVTTQHLP